MPEPDHSTASEIFPSAGVLLANRLRSWREQRGITIKRAAAELGVSAATWDHWEKGRRFPSMADLDLLAQYLRLPPCLIFCPDLHSQCGYCQNKTGNTIKSSSTNCRIKALDIPPMLTDYSCHK